MGFMVQKGECGGIRIYLFINAKLKLHLSSGMLKSAIDALKLLYGYGEVE